MSDISTSVLKVNTAAYRHNIGVVRKHIGDDCGIIAVVKSDAYGLGMIPMAQRAISENVDMLAVATVAEGMELREHYPDIPILVMVQPSEEDIPAAVQGDLRITVSNYATAEQLGLQASKMKKIMAIHCEIDTGMGRQGFSLEEAPKSLLKITRISNVDIEAIFTHFPSADEPEDPYTANQAKNFRTLQTQLSKDGIPFEYCHASNSAGIMLQQNCSFDMVRPGIMTYGVWPNNKVPEDSPLLPVIQWESKLVLIKNLPGGVSVNYGRIYKTQKPIRTGVIPVGYADGYPYALSNNADVLIRGTRCPVLGTVTMNQIVVDLSEVPEATVGDIAVLIGQDDEERIQVEELAHRANTIGYEILTGISARIPRVYLPA
ncbi:MAG: alanine racemase [Candidatus Hydrogenedentota bacterium]|nr:MAG: alanine racemase [Candidatus Hydrogenedentota bacterium]